MILIVSAMEEEAIKIQDKMLSKENIVFNEHEINKKLCKGTIANKQVISLTTGIGKVNAAMWTAYAIAKFNITHIVNAGTAGSIKEDPSIKILDIVISNKIAYHDFDLTMFGEKRRGQVPGCPAMFEANQYLLECAKQVIKENIVNINAHIGLILTGDQFVNDKNYVKMLRKEFPQALAIEMEGAAIAHVAYKFNIPFIITRAISDLTNEESNHLDFEQFLDQAATNSAIMLENLIKLI